MKKSLAILIAVMMTVSMAASAYACSAIYVGSALTADGTTFFAREEDYANSYNKLMNVAAAGAHKAGELYEGCYGFSYTFTHDSYSYTAFQDDNGAAVGYVCPDCDDTHAHTPYQAGGTNEKGVSMSATETLYGCDAVVDVDPFEDAGIEEAEITTVILSEAATAREGVELLLSIYDGAGCMDGAGIFIADANEVWYIENTTGHQYVALKLPSTLVFAEPNQSVIGLIDLDDTENVIASPKLIEVAEAAGTYVGDKEANTIDYINSYFVGQGMSSRMTGALNLFDPTANYGEEKPYDTSAYAVSNVAEDGSIVTLYNALTLDHPYTMADIVKYYHIAGIGSNRNTECHVFQLTPGDASVTGVTEWVAMNDCQWSVFTPYLPMLTTDTAASLQLSTLPAEFVTEKPEAGLFYATTARIYTEEGRKTVEGFKIFPENWADSMYWSVDVLSNLIETGVADEAFAADAAAKLAEVQAQIIADYQAEDGLLAQMKAAPDAATATAYSMEKVELVHSTLVDLTNALLAK